MAPLAQLHRHNGGFSIQYARYTQQKMRASMCIVDAALCSCAYMPETLEGGTLLDGLNLHADASKGLVLLQET